MGASLCGRQWRQKGRAIGYQKQPGHWCAFPLLNSLYGVLTRHSCQIQSIRKTQGTRTGQRQRHQPRNHLRRTTQETKTLLSHRSRTWSDCHYYPSQIQISRGHLRDPLTTSDYPPIPTRPLRLPLRTPPAVQSQDTSTIIDTTESRRWTYATTRWESIRSVRPPLRVRGEHCNPNGQSISQCPWRGSPDAISPQQQDGIHHGGERGRRRAGRRYSARGTHTRIVGEEVVSGESIRNPDDASICCHGGG